MNDDTLKQKLSSNLLQIDFERAIFFEWLEQKTRYLAKSYNDIFFNHDVIIIQSL